MRAFVAVEVPPPAGATGRASAPEHLTLLFLGEVPRERTAHLVEALRPVGESVGPFDATLEGVGAFPSSDRPRVVWVGVTDGATELVGLAFRVREALSGEGQPDRRETFAPHLTLFRVRSGTDRRRAADLLSGAVPPPSPRRFHVGEFVLKESELSPRGPTHRTLATVPLRGSGTS